MTSWVLFSLVILLLLIVFKLIVKIRSQRQRIDEVEKWHKLAVTDDLTGLMNRYAYNLKVGDLEIYSRKCNYSLILFDIDDFKKINDEKGHLEGDRVLKKCAEMLCNSFNSADTVVYRIGGDEFAVLSEKMTENELISNMIKVRNKEKSDLGFTLSKGYAMSMGRYTYRTVFKNADDMLYADKFSKKKYKLQK